ncbi:hypothetical protein JJL45_09895 [Tamlana sp. s12]|uniref:hypothetical protein n=1 Tax=Tamlana sp. s12 TaxID=1630406 RepID=UPI0008387063|nr:hypothetical protein [Tamlana sp. s12]QQY81241.1 hypothetical protein JJL45_09895 [Tamlana sp. s12]
MKVSILIILAFTFFNCKKNRSANDISGTWKMVYAEIIENDLTTVKDLSHTEFIKIINDSHFAFFNQDLTNDENFYGGGGTYLLNGDDYQEVLSYTSAKHFKDHKFSFKVQFKGDTLIQTGLEHIKEAGINRVITEKYLRLKS